MSRVKIVVHVPLESADEIRETLGCAGAGVVGNYTHCSFSFTGTGRFTPTEGGNPAIGKVGVPEAVTEESIEVVCDRADAKRILAALKTVLPYEEPAIEIYQLLEEDGL